jgi:CheY-like chemotaxis protein
VVKGGSDARNDLVVQVERFLARVSRQAVSPGAPRGPAPAVNGSADIGSALAVAEAQPAQPSAGALAGRKVLVVDDDVRNVFALTAMLERQGMVVMPAEGGEEAARILEATAGVVDVILLDMMMPEVDGYETLRRIRQRPEFERLPIIALTAKAMKGDRERCLEAGASDYIAKPIDGAQLLAMLDRWLNGS